MHQYRAQPLMGKDRMGALLHADETVIASNQPYGESYEHRPGNGQKIEQIPYTDQSHHRDESVSHGPPPPSRPGWSAARS
mmetsp:Transcript_34584/g.79971  ORF Transcript_34584/g.79971 Transcript_34584/m.79971 type:complete len:80 (+) Transcript_34584:102-341(+)